MTQITMQVDDNEVRAALHNATLAVESIPKKAIKEELQAAMEEARRYPPLLPNQRYKRTGTYFRSFKVAQAQSGGNAYTLLSDARQKGRRYTKYVGGLADGSAQATIHKGRWLLIADAVSRAVDRVVKRAEQLFRETLAKGPGGL